MHWSNEEKCLGLNTEIDPSSFAILLMIVLRQKDCERIAMHLSAAISLSQSLSRVILTRLQRVKCSVSNESFRHALYECLLEVKAVSS